MEAIKVEGLTKKYKDITAVDSLDLNILQGELFSLLGVNGAGKTTTIKMLSCLIKPTGGDAKLLENSIITNESNVKNHWSFSSGNRSCTKSYRERKS